MQATIRMARCRHTSRLLCHRRRLRFPEYRHRILLRKLLAQTLDNPNPARILRRGSKVAPFPSQIRIPFLLGWRSLGSAAQAFWRRLLAATTSARGWQIHRRRRTASPEDLLDLTVAIAAGRIQRVEEAPGIVSVITDEDIRRMGAQTLWDVLATIPGFEVLTDNVGRPRIAVRGIVSPRGTSESVLILLNGRRLNDNIYGGATVANLEIPVYNLKQIEVIRGPGSALFGTNAFAGVINLVTYTSQNFDGVEVAAGGGSFQTQQYSLVAARTLGAVGLSGSLQVRDTDGAALPVLVDSQTVTDRALAPFGIPPASLAPGTTKDDQRDIDATFGAAFRVHLQRANQRHRLGGLSAGSIFSAATGYAVSTSLLISQAVSLGRRVAITARASFAQVEIREDLQPLPPGYTNPSFLAFPQGILIDYTTNSRRTLADVVVDYETSSRNQLTAGGGFEREATFDLRAAGNLDLVTGAPLAQFLPLPFTILAPSHRTIATAFAPVLWNASQDVDHRGVRYDRYSDFGSTVNPRAALVWRLPASFHFKALYGRAFQAPTFSELFYSLPPAIVGNAGLRPQTINTLEFALGYQAKNLRVTGNYFANFIRDFITTTRPLSLEGLLGSLTFVNTAGLNIHGVEVEVRRTLDLDQAVFANYTYHHNAPREGGPLTPDLPAHLANAGATVSAGPYLSLTPTVLLRSSRPRIAIDPRPEAGAYGLLNLTVRLKSVFETLDLSATITNLLDTHYVDPSPFATLPGDYPRPGAPCWQSDYKF